MKYNPDEELLSLAAAAAALRIAPRTLREWIADGKLAGLKVGRQMFVEGRELDDYFARQRAEAGRRRAAASKATRRKAA